MILPGTANPLAYRSPGGYASLIKTAVATGDMSFLAPLSVRDAIWLEVERWLAEKRRLDEERTRYEFLDRRFEMMYYMLIDNREVLRHADYFAQIAALKEAKRPKFEFFPQERLPSVVMEREREKAEQERKEKEESMRGVARKPPMTRMERLKAMREAERKEQDELVRKSFNFMARVKAIQQVAGNEESENITLIGGPAPPSRGTQGQ